MRQQDTVGVQCSESRHTVCRLVSPVGAVKVRHLDLAEPCVAAEDALGCDHDRLVARVDHHGLVTGRVARRQQHLHAVTQEDVAIEQPGPGRECDGWRCPALWCSDEFDGDLLCVGSESFDVGFVSGQDGAARFGERNDEGVDG